MGKRKQTVPQKATEEKRQCLTWNMLENQPSSSTGSQIFEPGLTLIDDDDPRLAQELAEAEELMGQTRKKESEIAAIKRSQKETFYANEEIAEIFNLHLENCLFYVSVLRKPKLKPGEWSCDFGEFQITFQPGLNVVPLPDSLPDIGECWLYVGIQSDKSLLYFEIPDEEQNSGAAQSSKKKKRQEKKRILFWNVDIPLSIECMEALKCNVFQIVIDSYDFKTLTVDLKVIAMEGALSTLTFASEPTRPKKQNQAITTLVEQFYNILHPSYADLKFNKKHDIDELYREIKQRHDSENRVILSNIQHPSFKPQLRVYQQQAITWMVQKERQAQSDQGQVKSEELHMLYGEITTRDKQKLYYNKYGGMLVLEKPQPIAPPPAGILGDEMGLGKTVEVLGCMLHNPRKDITKPEKLPVIVDEERREESISDKGKKKEKQGKQKRGKKEKERKGKKEIKTKGKKGNGNKDKKRKSFEREPDSDSGSTIIYSDNTERVDTDKKTSDGVVRDKRENHAFEPVPSTSTAGEHEVLHTSESKSNNALDPSAIAGDTKQADIDKPGRLDHPAADNNVGLTIKDERSGVVKDNMIYSEDNSVEKVEDKIQKAVNSDVKDIENEVKEENDSFDEITGKIENDLGITNMEENVSRIDSVEESNVMKRKRSEINLKTMDDSQKLGKNIFTEMPASQRECFECICGATEAAATKKDARKHPVQCVKCSLWQHAECVNYDLKDVYRGEFKCPHCHVSSPAIVSGATLIISPASIAHQWVEEILKHVVKESLNVFMYTGVNKQGFIQPQTLALQDIVITTYETLRKEIDYVDLPHNNSSTGRRLRHPKRFMAIPSPITAVEWWRICLDEAQMVECTTTKTAEMALKLSAVNRWCVTGTPIQKGVEDLYGLLLFLGIDPFWVQQWWHKLVYNPFCHGIKAPMHDLLTSVLWRTVKKDVLDQINIPKQTEHVHWLTFSPVEDHFYRRQYKECSRLAIERLGKFPNRSTRLSNLDRYTINQLLYPLLRLRQACCHPQAVRGEFLPIHKSTLTMEQLLESLTKKAKQEAEESHRALVAAVNGQAGLDIINQQFVEAVEKYREVLRSVEEHKDTLHTDSLQQLHAMFNLQEILSSKPEGVDPTLRDELLPNQVKDLRASYMSKAVAYVYSTHDALTPVQEDVKNLQGQLNDGVDWWMEIIDWSVERDQQELLIEKVRDDLLDNRNPELNSVARSIRSVAGLEYIVETRLTSLKEAYERVLKAMKCLGGKPSQDLINKTVECCLRPVGEILKTCPFCASEELFEAYEARLFSFTEKTVVMGGDLPGTSNQVNTKRQGTWADSEVEKALKSILSFAKTYRVNEELIEFGTTHIKLFDAQKKEYKKLRTHWAGIKEHVSSFDELDMATTRLRVRLPDEPKPDTPQMNVLEPSELAHHKLKLASDKIVAEAELRKKLGQLLYLKNLEKSQLEGPGGVNPEPCPICQQELGKEWSVMQCGHCFCIECIRIVVDRYSFGGRRRTVKCAVCRQTSLHGEISYVTTSQGQCVDNDLALRVKGSHSTKVEAVVRCLLKIKRDDPTAKALVFSTWVDVLSVISTALTENEVEHRALYTPGKFQAHLSSFKQDEAVTALLLPVHSGANGLNLIEATYVILVEPVLNPAQELQAIGRVHRIGQTKPTQVHRFLIKHTIEQKMQILLGTMDVKATTKNAEENALTIGDLASLFTQQVETDETGHGEIPGPSFEEHDFVNNEESLTQQVETNETDDGEIPGPSFEENRHDFVNNNEDSLTQRVETDQTDDHEIPRPSNVGEECITSQELVDSHDIPGPSFKELRNNDDNDALGSHTQKETKEIDNHEIPEPSNMAIRNDVGEECISPQEQIDSNDIPRPSLEELRNNEDNVAQGSQTQVDTVEIENQKIPGPSNMAIRNDVGEVCISPEEQIDSNDIPRPSLEEMRINNDNDAQGSQTQKETEEIDN